MTRAYAILLFVAAIAFAVSPAFTPEFGGFDPDRFPIPQEDPPVQPAGYAFAIWGPIYLWLVAGMGFQLLMRHDDPGWRAVRLPLLVSLCVGAVWLVVALQSPLWATLLIWIMWGGAVLALLRAPWFDRWWGEGPIGLYAGWLTAASAVSVGLVLAGYGLIPPVGAAILCLLGATTLAVGILRARPHAWSFGAGFAWALVGVIVANWPDTPVVAALAALALVCVGVVLALQSDRPARTSARTNAPISGPD